MRQAIRVRLRWQAVTQLFPHVTRGRLKLILSGRLLILDQRQRWKLLFLRALVSGFVELPLKLLQLPDEAGIWIYEPALRAHQLRRRVQRQSVLLHEVRNNCGRRPADPGIAVNQNSATRREAIFHKTKHRCEVLLEVGCG